MQLDLFPADALLPGGSTTILNVRATIADGVVQLWRQETGGPAIAFSSPLTGADGNIRTGFVLYTDAGEVGVVQSGGCRCGQQLAYADLWPARRRVNTAL